MGPCSTQQHVKRVHASVPHIDEGWFAFRQGASGGAQSAAFLRAEFLCVGIYFKNLFKRFSSVQRAHSACLKFSSHGFSCNHAQLNTAHGLAGEAGIAEQVRSQRRDRKSGSLASWMAGKPWCICFVFVLAGGTRGVSLSDYAVLTPLFRSEMLHINRSNRALASGAREFRRSAMQFRSWREEGLRSRFGSRSSCHRVPDPAWQAAGACASLPPA